MYSFFMKKVPLKELKENLSYWTEIARQEGPILVTKHNVPYVSIFPPEDQKVRYGRYVGKKKVKPLLKEGICKDWLLYLQEDRDGEVS